MKLKRRTVKYLRMKRMYKLLRCMHIALSMTPTMDGRKRDMSQYNFGRKGNAKN